jgi:hypothetical protein
LAAPIARHQRVMVATANAAVSWSVPTDAQQVAAARIPTPSAGRDVIRLPQVQEVFCLWIVCEKGSCWSGVWAGVDRVDQALCFRGLRSGEGWLVVVW